MPMSKKDWKKKYRGKITTPEEALKNIRNGQTIFIGTGSAEPVVLTEALANMGDWFSDIRVIHLLAQREQRLANPEIASSFRYNTFFIGRGVEEAVAAGAADFTPMNLSELPEAMANGFVIINTALIMVSPPDDVGCCSLGVSVDTVKAAVENANIVIAQVNENMPRTHGNTMIPVERINYMIPADTPLIEVPPYPLDTVTLTIGRHISKLIEDGMTLHFEMGPISSAVMRYLDTKHDLGIHTDILTDDIMRLITSGVVTNNNKNLHRGKTVAITALGSQQLYDLLDNNKDVEFYPIDQVNDPFEIAKIANMMSIHAVQEMEISGLARVKSEGAAKIASLPTTMDFLNGIDRSKKSYSILALPSTNADGTRSRIVAESFGSGVFFNRSNVDFVVTEYGSVYIYGLSIRERVMALISIAHPKFRQQLMDEAKKHNYLHQDYIIPSETGSVYPHQFESWQTFKDDLRVFFRPIKPYDARRVQRMFYSLKPENARMRYHGSIKTLAWDEAKKLSTLDFSKDMAIVGLVGDRGSREMIAEGRYTYNPNNNMGDFDILVREDFQGYGIGTYLANFLNKIAYARGLSGVYADVLLENEATMALLNKAWPAAEKRIEYGTCTYTIRFPEEDVKHPKDSVLVYSGRFSDFSYGENHPYMPQRARMTYNLINSEGYFKEPWMRIEEPKMIAKETLFESHDPFFINSLEMANDGIWKDDYIKFNLGTDDCPIFRGLFDYVMLYASATSTAVNLIIEENANVVFNLLGGFHHASRGHAEGFCYVNDAIMAIDRFISHGYRVAYIDIDAHHGNGVQDAYYSDDRVLKISLHETGKNLYPWTGFENEIGEDKGKGFNINIPLPAKTDDEAYMRVFDRVVPRAVSAFKPTVVVVVAGADTHRSDPLSNLSLTNNGMMEAMTRIREFAYKMLILGSGGYDMKATSRAWCRVWAAANRIDAMPDYMASLGGTFLGEQDLAGSDVIDMSYNLTGKRKKDITAELERIARFHEKNTFPILER